MKSDIVVVATEVPERVDPDLREKRQKFKLRLRFRILTRDGFRCHYCGRPAREVHLKIDHILPIARGGTNESENLCAACSDCNGGKGDLILEGLI